MLACVVRATKAEERSPLAGTIRRRVVSLALGPVASNLPHVGITGGTN